MKETIYDVTIIGAGASGMMAAGRAAERGLSVLLLEHNRVVGKKLSITGGGRCNITNAEFDTHKLLANYGKAASFLYSPFSLFGVKESIAFFENRGLPIFVEDKNRAFPKSEKASDVVRLLEKYCLDNGVKIKTGVKVTGLKMDDGKVVGVETKEGDFYSKTVVVATGGASHKETGSTGDGFVWLEKIGHTVVAPTPTIVPLLVKESWVKNLAGKTLNEVKLTFCLEGKKAFIKKGSLLFTHKGISGPTVLNSSGKVADLLQSGGVTVKIDLFPELNERELEALLLEQFELNKNKKLRNVLGRVVKDGARGAVLQSLPKTDAEKMVNSVTKDERKRLIETMKSLTLTITGLMGFEKAVVADGGISLEEIDMRTMASKLYPNLFITGDLLHINRPSGGFSLQLCWTTGYLAGESVAAKK